MALFFFLCAFINNKLISIVLPICCVCCRLQRVILGAIRIIIRSIKLLVDYDVCIYTHYTHIHMYPTYFLLYYIKLLISIAMRMTRSIQIDHIENTEMVWDEMRREVEH